MNMGMEQQWNGIDMRNQSARIKYKTCPSALRPVYTSRGLAGLQHGTPQ